MTPPVDLQKTVPKDPCKDPGAAPRVNKADAKCTVAASPACPKIQDRFLVIKAEMEDERDKYDRALRKLNKYCFDRMDKLGESLRISRGLLSEQETRLSEG